MADGALEFMPELQCTKIRWHKLSSGDLWADLELMIYLRSQHEWRLLFMPKWCDEMLCGLWCICVIAEIAVTLSPVCVSLGPQIM